MEMPKPGSAHKKLEKLVGSWTGEEKMHPSPWAPQGSTATGVVENRVALDGFAVVQDYEQRHGNQVTFRGHGVFRWDAPRERYVLHWFDSMGMGPNEYVGSFDGPVLTLISDTGQGLSRTVFDLAGAGAYRFRMEQSEDGKQWQTLMEGSYTRRG